MTLWTYRFRPVIEGKELPIALESSWTWSRLVVGAPESSGAQAVDRLNFTEEPYRLHEVQAHVPGGPVLITAGPRNWWSFGVTITREGRTLWQSHPNPHAYLASLQAIMNTRGGQAAMDTGVFKRNAPAIATDIALGLLFFILGKTTDLRTSALVTAGVGLALVPIQALISRFAKRKVDLLGGLALFGVVMLLISAGFSWYFDSEFAVQLKATLMGSIAATAFAVDAVFGGRYMARRFSTYLAYRDLNLRRLSTAMALCALTMAAINLGVALTLSKDTWLHYTTWGDVVVVILLTQWAVNWARQSR